MDKYEIGKDFSLGFAAGISGTQPRLLSESDHWISGWDAAYPLRNEKSKRLNAYLVSIGEEPMGIVKLAGL